MQPTRKQLESVVHAIKALAAPDSDALSALCQAEWMLGRSEEALQSFRALLQTEPAATEADFDALYLEALRATDTCPIPLPRRYRLQEVFRLVRAIAPLQGLIAECGCYRGMSSYVICSALRRSNPAFDGAGYHIFDSFQGLSTPTTDDDVPEDWVGAETVRAMSQTGSFAASLETVRNNLRSFPGITYHPGWIPLSFKGLPAAVYRFVHVDVDLYDPTLDAFEYFYPRLAPGGYLVSDDYSWPGARRAVEEFAAERGLQLQITAFGQAVVQKPERAVSGP
jgi:hypothetical protein